MKTPVITEIKKFTSLKKKTENNVTALTNPETNWSKYK
jgi:hypothetical protein